MGRAWSPIGHTVFLPGIRMMRKLSRKQLRLSWQKMDKVTGKPQILLFIKSTAISYKEMTNGCGEDWNGKTQPSVQLESRRASIVGKRDSRGCSTQRAKAQCEWWDWSELKSTDNHIIEWQQDHPRSPLDAQASRPSIHKSQCTKRVVATR